MREIAISECCRTFMFSCVSGNNCEQNVALFSIVQTCGFTRTKYQDLSVDMSVDIPVDKSGQPYVNSLDSLSIKSVDQKCPTLTKRHV